MKKVFIVALLLAIVALPAVFAEFRLDMAIDVPFGAGAVSTELGESESIDILEYAILLPEFSGAFQGSFGPVNIGGGIRVFTLILQSVAWPMVYAELDFDRLALAANVGGGLFMTFGIVGSASDFTQFFVPDVSAWFKFSERFRVGAGFIALTHPEFGAGNFLYLGYLSGRFTLLF
jgi:hypothetical protein